MNIFLENINDELKKQRRLLIQSQRTLVHSPEGYLKCRLRKKGAAFYCCKVREGKEYTVNITTNKPLIKRLFYKKIGSIVFKRAKQNISILENVNKRYMANDFSDIIDELPATFRYTAKFLGEINTFDNSGKKPIQHFYEPDAHIHETVRGLLVRSKSEVIIANTLTRYGIPFEYEKTFPYPNSRGYYFEPDFTFHLPSEETWVWEHLGLLKLEAYSIKTAEKLRVYQKHGFLIGRNLILTQDDEAGNCSSAFIDKIVRTQLLPYFPQSSK